MKNVTIVERLLEDPRFDPTLSNNKAIASHCSAQWGSLSHLEACTTSGKSPWEAARTIGYQFEISFHSLLEDDYMQYVE